VHLFADLMSKRVLESAPAAFDTLGSGGRPTRGLNNTAFWRAVPATLAATDLGFSAMHKIANRRQ